MLQPTTHFETTHQLNMRLSPSSSLLLLVQDLDHYSFQSSDLAQPLSAYLKEVKVNDQGISLKEAFEQAQASQLNYVLQVSISNFSSKNLMKRKACDPKDRLADVFLTQNDTLVVKPEFVEPELIEEEEEEESTDEREISIPEGFVEIQPGFTPQQLSHQLLDELDHEMIEVLETMQSHKPSGRPGVGQPDHLHEPGFQQAQGFSEYKAKVKQATQPKEMLTPQFQASALVKKPINQQVLAQSQNQVLETQILENQILDAPEEKRFCGFVVSNPSDHLELHFKLYTVAQEALIDQAKYRISAGVEGWFSDTRFELVHQAMERLAQRYTGIKKSSGLFN